MDLRRIESRKRRERLERLEQIEIRKLTKRYNLIHTFPLLASDFNLIDDNAPTQIALGLLSWFNPNFKLLNY